MHRWVVCTIGSGYTLNNDVQEEYESNFYPNSVGLLKKDMGENWLIWLIGDNNHKVISKNSVEDIDITKTGDNFEHKICNICHRLLPIEEFDKNQNNLRGTVRRPSCRRCRTTIDKRAPKSSQAKSKEKTRPKFGAPFACPICKKRSIVGVTAKIVADHDHHTGNIRDFICDSCNTGLGRFKNGSNYLSNAINYIKKHDVLK